MKYKLIIILLLLTACSAYAASPYFNAAYSGGIIETFNLVFGPDKITFGDDGLTF